MCIWLQFWWNKITNFTINGFKKTEAENYANENGFKFAPIEKPSVKGDINLDGQCDINDVTLIQKYLVGKTELLESQITAIDVNIDGEKDINDATFIQKVLANKAVLK